MSQHRKYLRQYILASVTIVVLLVGGGRGVHQITKHGDQADARADSLSEVRSARSDSLRIALLAALPKNIATREDLEELLPTPVIHDSTTIIRYTPLVIRDTIAVHDTIQVVVKFTAKKPNWRLDARRNP